MTSTHDMTDEDAKLWSQQPSDGGVVRPSADEALPWSKQAVDGHRTVHLVGCHGGAGVDTLAALVRGTTAAGQAWPIRGDDETTTLPVVLVARTSLAGLTAAQFALRQYATAGAPDGTQLLGLALVAASPRSKLSKPEETKRRLITDGVAPLAPRVWDIRWHPELLGMAMEDLPTWSIEDEPIAKRRPRSLAVGITTDIAAFGDSLIAHLDEGESPDTAPSDIDSADDSVVTAGEEVAVPEAAIDLATDSVTSSAGSRSARTTRSFPSIPELPTNERYPAADDSVTEQLPAIPDAVAPPVDVDSTTPPAPPALPGVLQGSEPRRNPRRWVVAGAAALVGIAAVSGLAAVLWGGSSDESSPEEPPVAVSDDPTPVDPCPETVEGTTTSGNGVGDQSSGAGAILAWNYRYYVTRNAAAAKAVTAENAVAAEADLEEAISLVPAGTAHCVQITDRGHGVYAVELTVSNLSQPIRQLVQTKKVDDRWLIESFTKDKSST